VPHAVEIGHFLRQWDRGHRESLTLERRSIIGRIVSGALKRDDRWKALTLDHLGVSEHVLEDYLVHGDSVLLANLIHFLHMIRQVISDWLPIPDLLVLSEFNIQNTLPELQRDFCVLWNELVTESQNSRTYGISVRILWGVRQAYINLHRGTDAAVTAFSDSTSWTAAVLFRPSSYPLCNIPGHLSPYVHDSAMSEAPFADVTTPTIVPRHHSVGPAPTTLTPPTVTDVPSWLTSDSVQATSHARAGSSMGDILSPVATSSKHVLLAPTSNLAPLLDSGIDVAARDAGEHPTNSSTSNSDIPPLSTASTHIPQPISTPLSDSTVSPPLNAEHNAMPPSTAPGIPISSSPLPPLPPGHTPSADFRPYTATSTPEPDQRPRSPSTPPN
jgi:hypothetical protein